MAASNQARSTIAAGDVADRSAANGDDTRYAGGKGSVYHQLIRLMPPHRLYVEMFLGKGAILRNKRPAAASVGIDADEDVIGWWRRYLRKCPIPNLSLIHGHALLAPLMTMVDAESLVYVDPPYLIETRCQFRYAHEFETPQLHAALLRRMLELADRRRCKIMISGYPSSLYTAMLERDAGWNVHTYQSPTRGGMKTESVWFNFPRPKVIHDPRYAGAGFRERLRIKRKTARWVAMLRRMDPLERQVILEAVADLSVAAGAGRSPPAPAPEALSVIDDDGEGFPRTKL